MQTDEEGTNYPVKRLFDEACAAADAILEADAKLKADVVTKKQAIVNSLCVTLHLIEDWKDVAHKTAISKHLGQAYPAKDEDAVLPVVKRILRAKGKAMRTWYTNALKQAWVAEHRTADDLETYFADVPYTVAAKKWADAHSTRRRHKVTITCKLPDHVTVPEKGLAATLTKGEKPGEMVLEITEPASG
jgi:hypothetical protein